LIKKLDQVQTTSNVASDKTVSCRHQFTSWQHSVSWTTIADKSFKFWKMKSRQRENWVHRSSKSRSTCSRNKKNMLFAVVVLSHSSGWWGSNYTPITLGLCETQMSWVPYQSISLYIPFIISLSNEQKQTLSDSNPLKTNFQIRKSPQCRGWGYKYIHHWIELLMVHLFGLEETLSGRKSGGARVSNRLLVWQQPCLCKCASWRWNWLQPAGLVTSGRSGCMLGSRLHVSLQAGLATCWWLQVSLQAAGLAAGGRSQCRLGLAAGCRSPCKLQVSLQAAGLSL
jgi:hypothetical protein